jgi:hypothetical protein
MDGCHDGILHPALPIRTGHRSSPLSGSWTFLEVLRGEKLFEYILLLFLHTLLYKRYCNSCWEFDVKFPFQSCILSNDTSRPTLKAISHKQHAYIVNRKLYLYIVYYTPHSRMKIFSELAEQRRYTDTKTVRSFVIYSQLRSCNLSKLNSSLHEIA